ncbi:MAG: TolC family protein [Desulfobacterales bacterium]|nr:TolC family protein [Desulfobacterales bacterium]MDX2509026.1 TolC family protein [Desulfobacterales bacterium]
MKKSKTIKIQLSKIIKAFYLFIFFCLLSETLLIVSGYAADKKNPETLSLSQAVEIALKVNLALKKSKDEIDAARAIKNISRANFLPTFNTTYTYKRRDEEVSSIGSLRTMSVIVPLDEYSFVTSFSQPIFRRFSLINQYKVASFGLDIAKISEKATRLEVIFRAKEAFFTLLKAEKLYSVSQDAVKLLSALSEVAKNFYQVGMTPLNDWLKAQVELANAKQDLIVANNNLGIAKSQFNIILRRPVNATVEITDILDYSPLENDFDYYFNMADQNRFELKITDLNVEIAEREVKIAKKDLYPSINLDGAYYKIGTDWNRDGGEGISDPDGWSISAIATWNFWEWGRTCYGVKEKNSRLSQARYSKEELYDNIRLEVKQSYLKAKESEMNITAVDKAIEQAKENLRISEEQYKHQVATSTDVLDAQTLLSKTMTNYYNALYDFKIAKAFLHKAISLEVIE